MNTYIKKAKKNTKYNHKIAYVYYDNKNSISSMLIKAIAHKRACRYIDLLLHKNSKFESTKQMRASDKWWQYRRKTRKFIIRHGYIKKNDVIACKCGSTNLQMDSCLDGLGYGYTYICKDCGNEILYWHY